MNSSCLKLFRDASKGRGIVSQCYFVPGQTIETCPGVFLKEIPEGPLRDYVFSTVGGVVSAYSMCSMYNHSDTPNARWTVEGDVKDPNSWFVIIKAVRVIHPGEEILISYGDEYWASRGINPI